MPWLHNLAAAAPAGRGRQPRGVGGGGAAGAAPSRPLRSCPDQHALQRRVAGAAEAAEQQAGRLPAVTAASPARCLPAALPTVRAERAICRSDLQALPMPAIAWLACHALKTIRRACRGTAAWSGALSIADPGPSPPAAAPAASQALCCSCSACRALGPWPWPHGALPPMQLPPRCAPTARARVPRRCRRQLCRRLPPDPSLLPRLLPVACAGNGQAADRWQVRGLQSQGLDRRPQPRHAGAASLLPAPRPLLPLLPRTLYDWLPCAGRAPALHTRTLTTCQLPHHEQEVVSRLPLCTAEEFNAAVASAKDAFAKWRTVPVPQRARVMFKLQAGCSCGQIGCGRAAARGWMGGPRVGAGMPGTQPAPRRRAQQQGAGQAGGGASCYYSLFAWAPMVPLPAGADPAAHGRAGGQHHPGAGQDAGRRAGRRLPRPGCGTAASAAAAAAVAAYFCETVFRGAERREGPLAGCEKGALCAPVPPAAAQPCCCLHFTPPCLPPPHEQRWLSMRRALAGT